MGAEISELPAGSGAGARIWSMTAREKVLKEAPDWSEATANAVLAVVESQRKLERWFEEEAAAGEKPSADLGPASSQGVLGRMDEEEEAAGFSWEQYR
jgi:hypothetical protein